jgi:hypothetical protein
MSSYKILKAIDLDIIYEILQQEHRLRQITVTPPRLLFVANNRKAINASLALTEEMEDKPCSFWPCYFFC